MTMNGKHTIAEIRDLSATIEFRIKAVQKLIADTNTADRDATLLGLLPTIFVVVLIVGSLAVLFVGIKKLND